MLLAEDRKSVVSALPTRSAGAPLEAVESEVVNLFAQAGKAFGLPPSVGQIYGLLFIADKPMAMDHLIDRLQISKGSASQGLKFLRRVGAVSMVNLEEDRRVHYIAVAELRKLATGFLKDQVLPQLDTGIRRLEDVSARLDALPPAEKARLKRRLGMLQSWEKKTRRFLPLMVKMLGG